MITVDELKKKYPCPIRFSDKDLHPTTECYCVGGALGMYLRDAGVCDPNELDRGVGSACPVTFPAMITIAKLLRRAVPGMGASTANTYAGHIMSSNDCGNFDGAWKTLEEALAYCPTMQEVLAAKEKT